MTWFLAPLRRFREDQRGSLSVEAVLVLPFLLWAFAGLYTFFDGYRAQNVNLKAAYTISDMLSRETGTIDSDYIDGMNRVYDFLTYSPEDTEIRVTVITYIEGEDRHEIVCSESTGARNEITLANWDIVEDEIPNMPDGDTLIIVETWMTYDPLIDVGVSRKDMTNLIVTRPRFAPQLDCDF